MCEFFELVSTAFVIIHCTCDCSKLPRWSCHSLRVLRVVLFVGCCPAQCFDHYLWLLVLICCSASGLGTLLESFSSLVRPPCGRNISCIEMRVDGLSSFLPKLCIGALTAHAPSPRRGLRVGDVSTGLAVVLFVSARVRGGHHSAEFAASWFSIGVLSAIRLTVFEWSPWHEPVVGLATRRPLRLGLSCAGLLSGRLIGSVGLVRSIILPTRDEGE